MVESSLSSPPFTTAFHAAWRKAADRTMVNTGRDMGLVVLACFAGWILLEGLASASGINQSPLAAVLRWIAGGGSWMLCCFAGVAGDSLFDGRAPKRKQKAPSCPPGGSLIVVFDGFCTGIGFRA
jgi:hypothetical protein